MGEPLKSHSFTELIVAIREDDEETYQSIMMRWANNALFSFTGKESLHED